ncbi:ADL140Cp [Eremothecium gossypii ATCC 10895]|uniref:ADL140Cp n=1 Tax=Eremothecium gossypii (strain ATCC 10895 / CBS 109.51 / FGSC 9923 / NRRL Y-1056) TaxID=284811 RepID=Q75AR0_EREGS|nr:ADL140Cp [Eremothecium gossypii ATCC 10895]AAS51780.2 ADL140Cp [Eremothecium gossypii ATCC 10895]
MASRRSSDAGVKAMEVESEGHERVESSTAQQRESEREQSPQAAKVRKVAAAVEREVTAVAPRQASRPARGVPTAARAAQPGEKFQPLHQKPASALNVHAKGVGSVHKSLHKAMFKKALPSQQLKDKFASPTDSMLSPCTQKLNQHKSRLFKAAVKPTRLNFAQAKADSDEELEDV